MKNIAAVSGEDRDEDKPVPDRFPDRRRFLVLGAAGAIGLAGLVAQEQAGRAQKAAARLLTPEATEGPYWVDEKLRRADVRLDPVSKTLQKGLPLTLNVRVSQLKKGVLAPLSGAYVDIWHCNALGAYSDMAREGTAGQKFLRGYQVTNDRGQVQFTTIYPGWYHGRTVHIHARVRTVEGTRTTHDFTTQFFFEEAVSAHVYKQAPYSARAGRDTFNQGDGIYNMPARSGQPTRASGEMLMLKLVEDSRHAVGTFDMLLDLASLPAHSRGGGPGGGGFGLPPGDGPPGGPPPFGDRPPGEPPFGDRPPFGGAY